MVSLTGVSCVRHSNPSIHIIISRGEKTVHRCACCRERALSVSGMWRASQLTWMGIASTIISDETPLRLAEFYSGSVTLVGNTVWTVCQAFRNTLHTRMVKADRAMLTRQARFT